MKAIMIVSVLVVAVAANAFAAEKRTLFTSPSDQRIEVLSAIDFPNYGDGTWQFIGSQFGLANGFPYPAGGGTIWGYQKDGALIFEIFSGFKKNYLHAIIYYPDGRTPHFFQKMNLRSEGLGVAFRERPVDSFWTPEQLFELRMGQ